MLSPTSLSSLSVTPDYMRPVRAVSPSPATMQGSPQMAPLQMMPNALPNGGGQQGGGAPSRSTPRGSLLDISV
jgi:hypothetical protein